MKKPAGQFNHCLADFIAPTARNLNSERSTFRLPRRVCRHGGDRRGRTGESVCGRPRRLQRDPDQSAGGPAGGGVCGISPPRSAHRLGFRARRKTLAGRAASRKIPRHPAGGGLSRFTRSHGKEHALPIARRGEDDGHRADGIVCDASRRERERSLFFSSRFKILRGRKNRATTRCATTPRGKV